MVGVVLLVAAGATASATEDVPDPLMEAVHEAVGAWSQFAPTGDMAALGSSFVPGGPQWRQFETESVGWEGTPGGEPLRLEVQRLRLRNVDSTTATVWAEVEAGRPGSLSEIFSWDFDLIHSDGRWQVWTVVEAEQPPTTTARTPATHPRSVIETTTTTAPAAHVAVSEPKVVDGGPTAADSDQPQGTRLPVLSAWIVVVTVVGVAVAGYMAPRIDRRGEG